MPALVSLQIISDPDWDYYDLNVLPRIFDGDLHLDHYVHIPAYSFSKLASLTLVKQEDDSENNMVLSPSWTSLMGALC